MSDATFTFDGDASSLQRALGEIRQEITNTKGSVQGLAGQFVTAFAAIGSAVATVKQAFSSMGFISSEAARMEQTGLAFKVMMGDAATAAEYVAQLRKYAAETPFEFGDISDAAKTLISMGTSAEKSISVIKKLGDVASVSGKPLKDLAFLYAKAQNTGLTNEVAESLEMQGVPIRKLLAEMKGISFEQVFQGISKRQFNVGDLDAVLEKLTGAGGLLENMTKLQSQTFSGALSTLSDGFKNLAVEMGTPINAAILPVMQDMIAYLDSITPAVKEFAGALGTALSGAVSVIAPIVSGIGSMVTALGGAKTVVAALAAAVLMYAGNAKAATAGTVSFSAQLVTLGNTIKGLSLSSFVTAYRAALGGLGSAMSATLAGLKVTWSVAWSTMATVTRAAMVAVKAAIVSTGIGLIIVGIGEALGSLYNWFMGNKEAARAAAESTRSFERSLASLNKQANNVKTKEQYGAFMDQLEEQLNDLRDKYSAAWDNDEDSEETKALKEQIWRLIELRKQYAEKLPKQIEAAEAERRAAEAMRAQQEAAAELERNLAAAREKLGDLVERQREYEREQELSGLDAETQIQLRLADVTPYGKMRMTIADLKAEMDQISRMWSPTAEDAARYERLSEALNKIVGLQRQQREESKRSAEEAQRAAEERERENQARARAAQGYDLRRQMLQAEIAGNERKLEVLRQQQRVTQLTLEYQRQGLDDAEKRARNMAKLEQAADDAKKRRQGVDANPGRSRDSSGRIASSTAAAGGGGRAILVGGPMLTEAKKQTKLLGQMDESLKKRPSIQVSGKVDAVIAD